MARGRLFRSPLLTFGTIQPHGVTCEWTSELRPIGSSKVVAGQIVELHVALDAGTVTLGSSSPVRFDIVTAEVPQTQVAALVGSGADPPPPTAPTQARTTVFHRLADGETIESFRAAFVSAHDDFAAQLLVVADGDPPVRSHVLTWWTVEHAPEGMSSALDFAVAIDGSLHAKTEQSLDVGPGTLGDQGVKVALAYEDGTPMAGATFAAVFPGEHVIRGTSGPDGTAEFAAPTGVGEIFRLFVTSYPERIVVPVGPDPDVPPAPVPPRPSPAPPDMRPETVTVFAFDSAFPAPSVFAGLQRPQAKAGNAPEARLMVFGHCDKVGTDAYNDALSERRARAVLALLLDDPDMFNAVSKAEGWDTRVHQSMLRGIGCNPGAIDGNVGAMTRTAVTNFQREYNRGVYHERAVVERNRPTLPEDGSLAPATLAAIRDAYVAVAPHIRAERFAEPQSAGCGKHHPVSDADADNRRATVALFSADADLSAPCDDYDTLVGETTDDRHVPHFSDYQWLEEENGALHLSAATVAADGTAATFRVVRCEGPVPVPPPDSSGGGDPPTLGPQLAEIAGEIHGGIVYGRWTSPDGAVLDPDTWFVDHDVQLAIDEASDNEAPRDGDPASSTALLEADSVNAPVFIVQAGDKWGVSGPPGQRLERLEFEAPEESDAAEGVAIRTDGSLVRFLTDRSIVEVARTGDVISLALGDLDVRAFETGTA